MIALAGEAHTIAENLIKPCMLKAAEILLSKNDYENRRAFLYQTIQQHLV